MRLLLKAGRAGETGGGWVHTRDLAEGQTLRGLNGDLTVVELARDWQPQRVYNFEVETDHVYYVGGFAALTHNMCGDGGAPNSASAVPTPLGRGSTGRTQAENLMEQLSMEEVMADPFGTAISAKSGDGMKDKRWPKEEGWEKVRNKQGNIHWLINKALGLVDDFKFKA